jgi:hypothetical protein
LNVESSATRRGVLYFKGRFTIRANGETVSSVNRSRGLASTALLLGAISLVAPAFGEDGADFQAKADARREELIHSAEPEVDVPTRAVQRLVGYSWKQEIVTTVFALGRRGASGGTAWDPKWREHYGGFDDPDTNHRVNFIPKAFKPGLNPFYCALPYNDVGKGVTKPEAAMWIPWFKNAFVRSGQSICKDRWIAISNRVGRVCYAQWTDCGPFQSDHYQYVFGSELPRANANRGAGLNVSPAVRDYLGLEPTDYTKWKFVEFGEVPKGPWSLYGSNNPFVTGLAAPGVAASAEPLIIPLEPGERP